MTGRKLRSQTRTAAAQSSSAESARSIRTKATDEDRLKSLFTKSALIDRYGPFAKNRPKPVPGVISCETFSRQLHQYIGVDSLLKEASMIWQHGPADQMHLRRIPNEVEALGAKLCSRKGTELKSLEALIQDGRARIDVGYLPRDKDHNIDRLFLLDYDEARFEYRNLLIEIILNEVNARRRASNPVARGLTLRKTQPFVLDGKTIEPHDSSAIYDEDLEIPATTLYLPSEQAAATCVAPRGRHFLAFRAEIPLQMKLNDLLSYQGVGWDGHTARVTCARVDHVSDNLALHKTDFCSALYFFPEERNCFVTDMVNLLENHTDFRKAYTQSLSSASWNPRKKVVTYVLRDAEGRKRIVRLG